MSSAAQDEFDTYFNTKGEKASTHPEDAAYQSDKDSEHSADLDLHASSSDDDDNDVKKSNKSAIMPSAVYHIPQNTLFEANTGPKGVIADAKSFDRARKRSFRQTLYAFSNGLSGNVFDKYKLTHPSGSREKSSSPELSPDDEDDEFMRTWRANRMAEMQNGAHRIRRQSPSKRRFGYLSRVDAIGYLDAVEKVASDTVVVVCIYDEESTVSGIVEDSLSALARKHETTRFIKLSYEEADLDVMTVPAVLAYRGGELIANLVSVIDQIPSDRDMSAASMELLLQQNKVLC
ncbi:MAG: hypothetical protein MMC33_005936 [Icmadophila ericetorum]|nr:hypothetical protein [Icmadophila ericetorum]